MKKPSALVQLLEDLKSEYIQSDVEFTRSSEAHLFVNDEAVANEDSIKLSANDCVLLLATPSTAERFVEAVDNEEASIVLVDLQINNEVLEVLERSFIAVDEG